MPHRIKNRLKFQVERLVLRGAHYRLLVIAAAIGLVAVSAGLLVYLYAGVFAGPGEAIWWAFLRMADPGYLGDDQGVLLRVVSTVLTVVGFVLFVGALIAILTQWMNQSIRALESGFTPVALRNHVVILGWTNRTAAVVRELVLAEGRLKRFLRIHGARGLRIAILAEEVGAALRQELRDRLGALWKERQTVLRSGSPMRVEHLRRVDFANAAAVLIPATDFRHGGVTADTRVIKTLLSMGSQPVARERDLPLVVAEIFDARKIPIARDAYGGPIELLASDSIISRLIAQTVRHRGLSHVYGELLTYGRGNQIYVREHPALAGSTLAELAPLFPAAIVLGVARPSGASFSSMLNPPQGFRVEPGDRLALLARRYRDTDPASAGRAEILPVEPVLVEPVLVEPEGPLSQRRVLLMGWTGCPRFCGSSTATATSASTSTSFPPCPPTSASGTWPATMGSRAASPSPSWRATTPPRGTCAACSRRRTTTWSCWGATGWTRGRNRTRGPFSATCCCGGCFPRLAGRSFWWSCWIRGTFPFSAAARTRC